MKLLVSALVLSCLLICVEGLFTMRLGAAAASVAARGGADGEGRGGRGDGRGYGRHRGGRGGGFAPREASPPSPFVGVTPELGFTFDVAVDGTGDNIDLFARGHELLETWAGTGTKYTGDLALAVHNLALAMPLPPVADPGANPTFAQQETYKIESKERTEKMRVFTDFLSRLYNVVFGQCTQALKDKLRSLPEFVGTNQNGIELLLLLRTTMNRIQAADTNTVMGCLTMMKSFVDLKLNPHETLPVFYSKFMSMAETLNHMTINITPHPVLVEGTAVVGNPTQVEIEAARQKTLAAMFLMATASRYKNYAEDLKNSMLESDDRYPVTLAAAYNILQQRQPDNIPRVRGHGAAFATPARVVVAGDNGVTHAHIQCRNPECNAWGHFQNHCPLVNAAADGTGGEGNVHGFVFSQINAGVFIPKSWLLLDNQSTVDVICNPELLVDIHEVNELMQIKCGTGCRSTSQKGLLPGYGQVWYCPEFIANILSFANVASRYRVTYDNEESDRFVVWKEDGTERVFERSESGLYYYETAVAPLEAVVLLVKTVAQNKTGYTNLQVSRATLARKLQTSIGRPSTRRLIHIVNNNLLPNCPVTKRDIMAAEDIFGPDIGSLKGKTTRQAPRQVSTDVKYTTLPPQVHERYKIVTVCCDIMHVNGIMFFVSISECLKLGVIDDIPNKSMATIVKAMKTTAAIYHGGGFRIRHAVMDNAFDSLEEEFQRSLGIRLNVTSRDEHVGVIERFIRTIKERMRSTINVLPFKQIPARMVIELAKREVFWLNAFPSVDGVSSTLSPRTIVSGDTISYDRHCRFDFGEYVQTHEQHDNSMASRTVGALAMRPTGNLQGGFYFLSLDSGRIINRNSATKLPMPNETIDRIHRMARQQRANNGLVFGNRDGQPDDDDDGDGSQQDDDDDESYDPDGDEDDGHDDDDDGDDDDGDDGGNDDLANNDDDDDDTGDDDPDGGDDEDDIDVNDDDHEDEMPLEDVVSDVNSPSSRARIINQFCPRHIPEAQVESDDSSESESEPESESESEPESEPESDPDSDPGDMIGGVEDVGDEDEEEADDEDIDSRMDAQYGPRTGAHNLRARKKVSFNHLHGNVNATVGQEENAGVHERKTGVHTDNATPSLATPQVSMAKGLRMFGAEGELAISKEMHQLHDRMVMRAKDSKELSAQQKKDALAYLMFLKRKRTGSVKGRGCADGRKQRAWTDTADSTSPTIASEAVFLSIIQDALEARDIAIVDIPGAFMQVDMPEGEIVYVRLTGIMVDKLLEIDFEMYSPFVVYEGKVKCLYVELLKALYGTLRAARLFWEKLSGKLLEWGFVPNPYDSCVMNKMINGKQCTIGWHVDDLKISHVDPKVVDHVIELLDGEFGKEEPLTKSRGKVHDYLGMLLDFSGNDVKVDMSAYLRSVIADMPNEMEGTAPTPAAAHLFKTNVTNPVLLTGEKNATFVRLVMQLLYLCRGRPDIRTAISYLCKRTGEGVSDEDDYKKLTRVMRYLQGTVDLVLSLSADGSGIIRWWVDASYGVHMDMKSHTGAMMSLGKGAAYSMSGGQKIVGCSSTEAELIGVHDVMPQVIWTLNFLTAQGFEVKDNILYQDNMSTMLLAKNGRASVGKRSRHINIRYFFVKDRIANKELRIEHCPTEDMWADYFTKPLQGILFYRLRDQVMNIDSTSQHHSSHRSVLKVSDPAPKCPDPVMTSAQRNEPRTYKSVLMNQVV